MTRRFLYSGKWADGGSKEDPDTDTTNPSYVPNRYESLGWKSEKPPEEWQNYLSWINDSKMVELLELGILSWQDDVEYLPNALVFSNEQIYINTSGAISVGQDPLSGTLWTPIVAMYASSIPEYIQEFKDLLFKHLSESNPHKDTMQGIGGVDVDYVDAGFGDKDDYRTIVNHKAKTGRVHNESPAQVGTLPTTGGSFSGNIVFLKGLQLENDPTSVMRLSGSTGMMKFYGNGISLSINSRGDGYAVAGENQFLLVSIANFKEVQNSLNPWYTLPCPEFSFNLEHCLSDVTSSGNWILSVQDPVFEVGKGLRYDNNEILVTGFSYDADELRTAYLVGWDGENRVCEVIDLYINKVNNLSAFIEGTFGGTNVCLLQVYPLLTSEQKTQLVKSNVYQT